MQINPLLQNLIEQYFGSLDEIPPDLSQFLQTVNNLFVSVSMDSGAPSQQPASGPDPSINALLAEQQISAVQEISVEIASCSSPQELFNLFTSRLQKNFDFLSTRMFGYPDGSQTLA